MSRTIIVSNRVPLPSKTGAQAGGLAVVLHDLLEQRGGLWFGWSGAISDQTGMTTQRAGAVTYATIDLSQAEHDGYYTGFSNSVLWPLLHMMPGLIAYQRSDAATYDRVNERMADALAELVRPDDTIWVQDYHLFALPAALRARGLRNPIGFFLHIPFPPAAMLATVPGMERLVRKVLAADLLGFQTRQDAANFEASACAVAHARIMAPGLLSIGRRTARVGVFPVEIEPDQFADIAIRSAAEAPSIRLKTSLRGQRLVLGVDRLDPSKGLPERLDAFRRLLERHAEWRGHVTLLQIAAASRTEVDAYRCLRQRLDGLAGFINSEYGTPDWTPVRLIARACDRDTVAGYMRQAHVALVTPLRDGMNVVAKEYIAAQNPADPGVLVLSRFAGAADQLTDALLVNPNDPDTITDALDTALRMELPARQASWTGAWNAIKDRSAQLWGDSFLTALADQPAEMEPTTNRVVRMTPRPIAPPSPPLLHPPFGHFGNRTH